MAAEATVIGAGPAGMSAAVALAEHGVGVQVIDEQSAPGGQVYRAVEKVHATRAGQLALLGEDYARGIDLVERFRASGATFVPATAVWEIEPGDGESPLLIRTLQHGRAATLATRHLILATGAMERPTPFPGWTLPGVMGVGAAQTLLKDAALVPDGRVVLAGSGPLLYLYAAQLLNAGVTPQRILDTTPAPTFEALRALPAAALGGARQLLRGARWLAELRRADVRTESRVSALQALGARRLEAVRFRRRERWEQLDADLLLVHDGVVPNSWLAMSLGCAHTWHPSQQCWTPTLDPLGASSRASVSIAGDAGGIGGSEVARVRGRLAGLAVARRCGRLDAARADRELTLGRGELHRLARLRRFLDGYFPPAASFRHPPDPETLVCRCEEVSVAELERVARLGVVGPNQGKAFTRCGMGPCMGRECAATVSQLIARHHGLPMDTVGHYRIRPPVRPITVGQLADMETAPPPG